MNGKVFLYWHTVRNLKAVQIKGQAVRKIKARQKPKNYILTGKPGKVHIFILELDEDERYLARFDMEALMLGEAELLYEKHRIKKEWNETSASHLWNYNLHYLEFLVPLAVKYKLTGNEEYKAKWIEIVSSWMENAGNSNDAYEAYTISLRIPNILIGMELLNIEDRQIYMSLYKQYKYLIKNQELALLANHYFENIKTIVISSILFKEMDIYNQYFERFLEQIHEQILPDGLHYERSLMYHKIILEDILRVYTVLQHSNHLRDAKKLLPFVRVMAEALNLETGFDHTPLFNDAGNNVAKSSSALLAAAGKCCKEISMTKKLFPAAGFFRLDHENDTVLFFCGDIGPKYMGGHAHNDCLSFELSVDGKALFTNSGTGQYQGSLRTFFRSTAAHNTIMADDREQSELWGEHRAGRRLKKLKVKADSKMVCGQFCSYQGDVFRRQLQWRGNTLVITDDVKSEGSHFSRQFLHLAPGHVFEREAASVKVMKNEKCIAAVVLPAGSDFLIHKYGEITVYAQDFGKYEHKQVLEIRTPFVNAVQLKTEIVIKN